MSLKEEEQVTILAILREIMRFLTTVETAKSFEDVKSKANYHSENIGKYYRELVKVFQMEDEGIKKIDQLQIRLGTV